MPNQVLYPHLHVSDFETHSKISTTQLEHRFAAKLHIENHLPLRFAQGIFAAPGTHDVTVHVMPASESCYCDSEFPAPPRMTIACVGDSPIRLATTDQSTVHAHQCNHPMDEVYFSEAPVVYGEHIASFCLVPSSPGLIALKNHPFSAETPNALHEATIAFFQYNPAEFELKVQLEESSQYHSVARLIIPAQSVYPALENFESATFSHTLAA